MWKLFARACSNCRDGENKVLSEGASRLSKINCYYHFRMHGTLARNVPRTKRKREKKREEKKKRPGLRAWKNTRRVENNLFTKARFFPIFNIALYYVSHDIYSAIPRTFRASTNGRNLPLKGSPLRRTKFLFFIKNEGPYDPLAFVRGNGAICKDIVIR